jgi:hypothetical protein
MSSSEEVRNAYIITMPQKHREVPHSFWEALRKLQIAIWEVAGRKAVPPSRLQTDGHVV